MTRWIIAIILLISLATAGCWGERELYSPDDVGVLGVDAMLLVDKRLPRITLYRTQPPDLDLNSWYAGESGATVTLHFDTFIVHYRESDPDYGGAPGKYVPWYSDPYGPQRILPETTYRLEVTTRSGERLSAETATPPRLSVAEWVLLDDQGVEVQRQLRTFSEDWYRVFEVPENQLVYSQGLLEARLNPVQTPAYQAGIYSLDFDSELAIDPEFLEEEDLEEFERRISSPLILPSETTIRLPWFAIYFLGRYKIKIFAVDRNWYDLARSSPEFEGGGSGFGGNAGDDFERPIFHVEGGIGIFGSASMDSVGFFVHPRP